MTKKELKEWLVEEAEYREERVNEMTDFELFDAFLRWNGIIGWSYEIADLVSHLNLKE